MCAELEALLWEKLLLLGCIKKKKIFPSVLALQKLIYYNEITLISSGIMIRLCFLLQMKIHNRWGSASCCVCLPDVWCERQKWCTKSVKLLRTRPQPPQLPRAHLLNRTYWPRITRAAQSLHTWCRFHGMLGGVMFTAVCTFACTLLRKKRFLLN